MLFVYDDKPKIWKRCEQAQNVGPIITVNFSVFSRVQTGRSAPRPKVLNL